MIKLTLKESVIEIDTNDRLWLMIDILISDAVYFFV